MRPAQLLSIASHFAAARWRAAVLRGPALAAVESCPSAERGPLRGFNCSAYTFNQPPDVAFP